MSLAAIDLDVEGFGTAEQHETSADSSSTVSVKRLLKDCMSRYYFEQEWNVSFPKLPKAPMLIVPTEELERVLEVEGAVMNSELQAMSTGMLDSIPIAHFPLIPSEIRHTKEIVRRNQQAFEDQQNNLLLQGHRSKILWTAREKNPELDEKDFELLDVDLDAGLLEQRSMPSLTLLQRPLYTEIGLSAPSDRHRERLLRLIPPELLSLMLPNLDSQSAANLMQAISTAGSDDDLRKAMESVANLNREPSSAGKPEPTSEELWVSGINNGFKTAKLVDKQHVELLAKIMIEKLALGHVKSELKKGAVRFTEEFWELLFDGTTGAQQQTLWRLFTNRAKQVVIGSSESLPVVSQLPEGLPHSNQWHTLAQVYESLLATVDRDEAAVELNIDVADCADVPFFSPAVVAGNSFRKHFSNRLIDPRDGKSKLPVFPISVTPIFPSGFRDVIEKAKCGEISDEFDASLASGAANASHVVIHGVKELLQRERGCREPHVLVSNTTLFVAEEKDGMELLDEGCVSYSTSESHVVERFLEDKRNTGSVLLTLRKDCCEYDLVPQREEYRKNPAATPPPYAQYVVCFSDAVVEEEQALKRRRLESRAAVPA